MTDRSSAVVVGLVIVGLAVGLLGYSHLDVKNRVTALEAEHAKFNLELPNLRINLGGPKPQPKTPPKRGDVGATDAKD